MEFEETRASLRKALIKGDFERAKEKITDNLQLVNSNVRELQEYLFKIGSKRDNKSLMDKADKNILTTGNIFNETYQLIKDFSEHKFNNKGEKIENIKKIKSYEEQCNKFHEKFNEIVNNIKRQDMKLIESARNSIRMSTLRQDTMDLRKDSQQMNVIFMNGKEYLYSEVEDREKTVNLISKVMSQLNEHSKEQSKMVFKQGEMINSIEANITETKNNMDHAVIEIKEANEANKSTGGMLNKAVYIVLVIVILLILMSSIMPK